MYCLEEGEKQGHSSIAFQAIGTGNLNYPHNVVAEEMFKSVIAFGSTKSIKNLLEVRFILYHRDDKSIQVFNNKKVLEIYIIFHQI
jgi:O-acetyl-ADP-ribose deacetylase (regulator of RNase III)